MELEGPGDVVSQDDRRQKERFRSTKQIDDVLAGASPGLRRRLVRHEGIGGQRQCFIEQEQRKEIGGERNAHGGGQREREAREVARLCVLPQRAHVAD